MLVFNKHPTYGTVPVERSFTLEPRVYADKPKSTKNGTSAVEVMCLQTCFSFII